MTAPGMQWSALDFISSAMRLAGILGSGEVPTDAEANDGLATANQMLDSANADGLMIFTRLIQDFAFVAEKQTYKLGLGGDFNVDRPAKLERVSIVLNNNAAQPIEIPITLYTDQDWQKVAIKAVDSTFPLAVYDDGAYPFRNLNFWPVPRDTTSFPRLYSWSQLSQFPDLTTAQTFPPAYYEWIRFNLAVRLAPEYQTALRPEVIGLADAATAKIKLMNSDDEALIADLGVGPGPSQRKVRNELFSIP